jgi:protein-disulfide isomerase
VTIPENVKRYDVPIAGNPIYGDPNAPITIIEFSDYQCPFCQRWHAEVWPQIESKYGDKIRLVYRDFPLESIHPQAVPAAEAADCAGAQNKYWEFNNLLFGGGKELGTETYDAYAQQVGLKMDDFKKCVADRSYQKEVQDDTNFAAELGVRSTPTFFINGLAVVGAQPFSVFDQVISLELSGKIPK